MGKTTATTARKDANGRALHAGEYQRKSGSYEYKYREGGRQISISAKTLDELREKERANAKDRANGISTQAGRNTLNAYFEIWQKLKRGLKANTRSNYIYMYQKFIAQGIGRRKIAEIKRSDIIGLYNDLFDSGIRSNTLDVIQNVLHQIFEIACNDDAIRRNPTDRALRELKREHPQAKKKALTLDEQRRFLAIIRGTIWEPVFSFLLATGLRVGEVSGLIWDDIDEAAGLIHIRRTLVYYKDATTGQMERRINSTKTVAGFRDLPLSDDARAALDLQRKIGHACTAEIDGITGFIFGNRYADVHGQHTLNRAIRRIIKDANEQAGPDTVLLPVFSCHTLRHTFATNHARAGTDITTLMGLLGHSDVQTTIGIYTEAQTDMKQAADRGRQAYTSRG